MARFAYVNASYVRHEEAGVHIEDRGFQFADSVYEVIYLYKGRMIDADAHLNRLEYSLGELGMDMPKSKAALMVNIKELVRRNTLKTGLVYMQVSRGRAERDFPIPTNAVPSIVITTRRLPPFNPQTDLKGIRVKSTPDLRWKRCDIKTTALLAASLAKQEALDNGYADAWLVDEKGDVTEGTSNNAWILRTDGKLQTRKPTHKILNGITRQCIIRLAAQKGIEIIEEPFSLEEAYSAQEAFITSASTCVKPVVQIDDHIIGTGETGSLCRDIANIYTAFLEGKTS